MKNKKVLAIVMAVMTAASALVGCGSTEATAPADTAVTTEKEDDATAEAAPTTDGEQVTITFMHDWPEYEEEFKQMISDFEAANPDVKVETQIITWDVLTQTLTTAFAAGEAPDVACCWANQMGSFNSVGATYDLTPYLEENNNEWRDSLLAPAVQSGTVNDQVFCIPFRTTCTVLAYNKTMMEENGWEVPTTLEEFETLLGEAAKTGVTPLLTPGNPHGFQIASLVETFALHYMYDAGYLKNNDYLTGHYTDVAKVVKQGRRAFGCRERHNANFETGFCGVLFKICQFIVVYERKQTFLQIELTGSIFSRHSKRIRINVTFVNPVS